MFNNGGRPAAHVLALTFVGGYLVYMAGKMISNVHTGSSSMDMHTAAVLAAVMGLAGAAVIGYGIYLGYRAGKQKKQEDQSE